MIISQDIYSFKNYNKECVRFNSSDRCILSSNTNINQLKNSAYFVVSTPQIDMFDEQDILWITDDGKLLSIADALTFFDTAADMMDTFRQKKTFADITDYITYLKL